jgi:DNA-binding NarL/FixJ family response regulator
MPEMNGIQAVRLLQAAGSTVRIIFLTALEDTDFISAVLELGPHSYVFKSRCHIDLLSAITAATQGSVFCSSRLKAANPAC